MKQTNLQSAHKASIGIIAFTRKGCLYAKKVAERLALCAECENVRFTVSGPKRYAEECQVQDYGSLDAWTAAHFASDEALVFVGASGIAVRAIAPYVRDKFTDPAVVSVDEAGRFVVPLLSGHVGGANELARAIAAETGGQAVVSTATDVNGLFAVDEWAARLGLAIVERDVAKQISARLLEGGRVGFQTDFEAYGNVPEQVISNATDLGFVVSLDDTCQPFERTLHLVPRIATIGVGCRKGTEPETLKQSVDAVLAAAKVSHHAVSTLSSIDVKCEERAILQLASERGWETRFYSADQLASLPGDFTASDFVKKTVGVDNVCERSALMEGGQLAVGKQAGDGVTVALAIRNPDERGSVAGYDNQPETESVREMETRNESAHSKLWVVGIGPGGADDMSARAKAAIRESDMIAGYTVYIDLLKEEFPDKEFVTTPMRKEVERCRMALDAAAEGRSVAMVCSGDPGVYGMAGLIFELAAEYPPVDIKVIPGVSASNGGAAVLGAPLMHDYCVISLSDLLTPWEKIEKRLAAAAEADFVISLYNPSSHKRSDYLQRACDILLQHKSPETVCGTVRNIGREGELATVCTLAELRDTQVDMFTTVFIGNSQTLNLNGKMVTPRGYLQRED